MVRADRPRATIAVYPVVAGIGRGLDGEPRWQRLKAGARSTSSSLAATIRGGPSLRMRWRVRRIHTDPGAAASGRAFGNGHAGGAGIGADTGALAFLFAATIAVRLAARVALSCVLDPAMEASGGEEHEQRRCMQSLHTVVTAEGRLAFTDGRRRAHVAAPPGSARPWSPQYWPNGEPEWKRLKDRPPAASLDGPTCGTTSCRSG